MIASVDVNNPTLTHVSPSQIIRCGMRIVRLKAVRIAIEAGIGQRLGVITRSYWAVLEHGVRRGTCQRSSL